MITPQKLSIINLGLYDTCGQEDYDALRPIAYPHTDIFLFAFDITNRTSFRNVKLKWKGEIQVHCPGVLFILVGTKKDLRPEASMISALDSKTQDVVGEHEIQYMVQDIGAVKYCEVSALTQEGLKNVFDEAIIAVLYNR